MSKAALGSISVIACIFGVMATSFYDKHQTEESLSSSGHLLNESDTISALGLPATYAKVFETENRASFYTSGNVQVRSLGGAFTRAEERATKSGNQSWAIAYDGNGDEVARVRCNPGQKDQPTQCNVFKPAF